MSLPSSPPEGTARAPLASPGNVRRAFLLAGVLVVISLGLAHVVSEEAVRAAERVARHEALRQQMRTTYSAVLDAEIGQRGYLLTRREDYLSPYERTLSRVNGDLQSMNEAVARGEIPAPEVERFRTALQRKLAELEGSLKVAREQGIDVAVAAASTDAGKSALDEIRATFAELERRQAERIAAYRIRASEIRTVQRLLFAGLVVANVGCFLWAFRRVRVETEQRLRANEETQAHRDLLAVSLASVAEGVIITDPDGTVTFINEVAVRLTGWAEHEALGRSVAEVFRVLDPETAARAPDPVRRALDSREPTPGAGVTGLLVRRDGAEMPIQASASPVRERAGQLQGVILVFRDHSESLAAERSQRELRDRLQRANQAKDDFLATLSHELRTPLTPVLATLSAWRQRDELPAEFAGDIERLERNVRLETRLIDDLLDLTRVARGELTLHRVPVDVHMLIEAVAGMFGEELGRGQVRLGLRLAAERHVVDGDGARLQQVFWNIVGNAVKFTPEGGRIEIVTGNEGGGALRITIADNGRGMSEATLAGLFQPFERAAGARAYRSGGLGIGLAISKSLLDAHGGGIEVKSAGMGLGSTFLIRLPTIDVPARSAPAPGPAAAPETAVEPRSLSLLLVEDHADSADVLGRLLSSLGHKVQVAGTVSDALVILGGHPAVDLVLSDIGLPDGSGLDLIARAREFSRVPMVAITGYGMAEDLERYLAAGFEKQLTKPVRYEQLEELLREYASRAA